MGNYKLPGAGLGNATPDKVLEGSTFTSNNGAKQAGTIQDVSDEVTAQKTLVKEILVSLKIPETPPVGTNNQILQTNNANLNKIKDMFYRLPVSLEITPPAKVKYEPNDTLDLAGMVVNCTFDNGVVEDVTMLCTVSPMSFATEGTHTVTVSYDEQIVITGTFDIEVSNLKIVTWAGGTDEEIVAMVQAADRGKINLADYWTVGDEREVELAAMPSTYVSESHVKQTVTMVLMHQGQYQLVNGKTCNFVVGQKNCLKESGYMNGGSSNLGSWDNCARRKWCNEVYYNSLPITIKPIFKKFNTITAAEYNGSTLKTSEDFFALATEREIFGYCVRCIDAEKVSADIFQFKFYQVESNRKKLFKAYLYEPCSWWERTPPKGDKTAFCLVDSNGKSTYYTASTNSHLAPFGCI